MYQRVSFYLDWIEKVRNEKECGASFYRHNVMESNTYNSKPKPIEAIPHSWPSIAQIVFHYKFDYLDSDKRTRTGFVSMECEGTLISRNEILTAAQLV